MRRESTVASDVRSLPGKVLAVIACIGPLPWMTACGVTGSDPVLERWQSRPHLPGCGSLSLHQGQALEVDGPAALACLQRALDSGRGAELIVRHPTTEGDPVTSYHRVTAEGSTEVYIDSTQDAFSDGTWSFASCDRPETAIDVNC